MGIVVTGATGKLGQFVVEALLDKVDGNQITAIVRDPDKAAGYAARDVKVKPADYEQPETFLNIFHRGDKVLLISGNEPGRRVAQHKVVIDAAKKAEVSLLAYTSILGGPDADFDLASDHKTTEQAILSSGLPYVLLRNGWYNENYTENLGPVLEHGAITQAAGDGRVASAARADYAAAASVVLTSEGHENKAYELSGDSAWSFAEYAAELSAQTGKDIVYNSVSPQTYQSILISTGMPDAVAALVVNIDQAIERGLLARQNGDLARLIGRATTPMADSIAAALKG
ncbi:MAG: SDR family oxidoreductase [Corynebacteriales bacterium]|nr:SDR family oxidoreductase [Mycobacteriales bacterium]